MEREQFKVLVKAMKAVYAQPTFIPDQDAFNVWFALLGDLPYKQAELAVQKHMATKKPDWDNIGKIVCDSLNNIAYHDDTGQHVSRIAVGNQKYVQFREKYEKD